MKLLFKTLSISLFGLFLTAYIAGCSSAEQTTAKLAFQQKDYAKAETEFDKEVKQNPANEEAWFYLGASRVLLNKIDAADLAFKEYRKIGKNTFAPDMADLWTGFYNKGADLFNTAQKTADNDAKVKYYNNAIEQFKICKVILPDSTEVDKFINASQNKIAMLTVNPDIEKGVKLDSLGKFDEAVAAYNKALEKTDKGSVIYEIIANDISISYLKWGEKLRTDSPDDPGYKEKYRAAMPFLEDLKESKDIKTKIQAYDLLVSVYGNLGMNDKAKDAIDMRDKLKAENK